MTKRSEDSSCQSPKVEVRRKSAFTQSPTSPSTHSDKFVDAQMNFQGDCGEADLKSKSSSYDGSSCQTVRPGKGSSGSSGSLVMEESGRVLSKKQNQQQQQSASSFPLHVQVVFLFAGPDSENSGVSLVESQNENGKAAGQIQSPWTPLITSPASPFPSSTIIATTTTTKNADFNSSSSNNSVASSKSKRMVMDVGTPLICGADTTVQSLLAKIARFQSSNNSIILTPWMVSDSASAHESDDDEMYSCDGRRQTSSSASVSRLQIDTSFKDGSLPRKISVYSSDGCLLSMDSVLSEVIKSKSQRVSSLSVLFECDPKGHWKHIWKGWCNEWSRSTTANSSAVCSQSSPFSLFPSPAVSSLSRPQSLGSTASYYQSGPASTGAGKLFHFLATIIPPKDSFESELLQGLGDEPQSAMREAPFIKISVPGNFNVWNIKQSLLSHDDFIPVVLTHWKHDLQLTMDDVLSWDLQSMRFKYFDYERSRWIEMFDETQNVFSLRASELALATSTPLKLYLGRDRSRIKSRSLQKLNFRLGVLMDFGLYRFHQMNEKQIDMFRKCMVKYRRRITTKRDDESYLLNVQLAPTLVKNSSESLFQSLSSVLVKGENLLLRLHTNARDDDASGTVLVKTILASWKETPRKVIEYYLNRVSSSKVSPASIFAASSDASMTSSDSSSNCFRKSNSSSISTSSLSALFTLKVLGQNQYLHGNHELINFRYIRDCLSSDNVKPINLVLVPLDVNALEAVPLEEEFGEIEEARLPVGLSASLKPVTEPFLDSFTFEARKSSSLSLSFRSPLDAKIFDFNSSSLKFQDEHGAFISQWSLTFQPYQIEIQSLSFNLGNEALLEPDDKVGLEITMYNGAEAITPSVVLILSGSDLIPNNNNHVLATLPINISDIPRYARLCFRLFDESKTQRLPIKSSNIGNGTDLGPDNVANRISGSSETAYPPLINWINGNKCTSFLISDCQGIIKTGQYRVLLSEDHHQYVPVSSLSPPPSASPLPVVSPVSASFVYFNSPVAGLITDKNCIALGFAIPGYEKPIVYPEDEPQVMSVDECLDMTCSFDCIDDSIQPILQDAICNGNSLFTISEHVAKLIWQYRYSLRNVPEALPQFLSVVRWNDLHQTLEARRLMKSWDMLLPEQALQLLDVKYNDPFVREYAISVLESTMSDDQILLYLPQLIQVLKYEPYLDNCLTRFLLKKAWLNRRIGNSLFWFLKSELHMMDNVTRYALILEAYLRGCSESVLVDLENQNVIVERFKRVADAIKQMKGNVERKEALTELLVGLELPEKFIIDFGIGSSFSYSVGTLIPEKCRFMDSKKLPLWLVFDNHDAGADAIKVIFKSGDDLRQDMLTLQMMTLMDRMWKKAGLDLRMSIYGCLSMGDGVGMIQVVPGAETVSRIQMAYGGSSAAFKDEPLAEWIRSHNRTHSGYLQAVRNFTLSCAGYCVATYVLGIGDRHNDNIMVTQDGHLLHIDFGHFLGNIKRKFGIKRERAPFVLTPDFIHVMKSAYIDENDDGTGFFDLFMESCVSAYLEIHRNGSHFINLFSMMLSTGIPELKSPQDLEYLRESLCIGRTESEASEHFRRLVRESLRMGWSTQLNWWIHNIAHK